MTFDQDQDSDEKNRERDKIIDRALSLITEHFESVQIFASRVDGDETIYVNIGRGNMFTRLGQTRDWLDSYLAAKKYDDE